MTLPDRHPRLHTVTWLARCDVCAHLSWWGTDPKGTGASEPDVYCPTCDD